MALLLGIAILILAGTLLPEAPFPRDTDGHLPDDRSIVAAVIGCHWRVSRLRISRPCRIGERPR